MNKKQKVVICLVLILIGVSCVFVGWYMHNLIYGHLEIRQDTNKTYELSDKEYSSWTPGLSESQRERSKDSTFWHVVGWIIWGILVVIAVSWAYGCRTYAKYGLGFHHATGMQTFFLWVIAVLFLFCDWHKLHILWVGPASIFLAQFLVIGGIPGLSQLCILATTLFLEIILMGIGQDDTKD